MVEIIDLALRTVIDSFKIYTMNSLIESKNFENNFITSKALLAIPKPKQQKILLFLLQEELCHVNSFSTEYPVLTINVCSKFLPFDDF